MEAFNLPFRPGAGSARKTTSNESGAAVARRGTEGPFVISSTPTVRNVNARTKDTSEDGAVSTTLQGSAHDTVQHGQKRTAGEANVDVEETNVEKRIRPIQPPSPEWELSDAEGEQGHPDQSGKDKEVASQWKDPLDSDGSS